LRFEIITALKISVMISIFRTEVRDVRKWMDYMRLGEGLENRGTRLDSSVPLSEVRIVGKWTVYVRL
jgi:hypothetical protein